MGSDKHWQARLYRQWCRVTSQVRGTAVLAEGVGVQGPYISAGLETEKEGSTDVRHLKANGKRLMMDFLLPAEFVSWCSRLIGNQFLSKPIEKNVCLIQK